MYIQMFSQLDGDNLNMFSIKLPINRFQNIGIMFGMMTSNQHVLSNNGDVYDVMLMTSLIFLTMK